MYALGDGGSHQVEVQTQALGEDVFSVDTSILALRWQILKNVPINIRTQRTTTRTRPTSKNDEHTKARM